MTSPQESLGGRGLDPMLVRRLGERAELRSRSIVLIGPMAAGKSTIGVRLASLVGHDFIDTDQEFERKNGPISNAFASLGEFAFREMEARIVASALEQEKTVISLGGGAILDAGTQQLLRDEFVVYLETDADTVRPFITRDRKRPLLAENPVEAWQSVYDRRRSTYERLSSLTVDVSRTTRRSPDEIVQKIRRLIEETTAPTESAPTS